MMTFVLQKGQNSFYTASARGHLEVLKALVKAKANVNQCDKVGGTHTCIFSVIVAHSHPHMYIVLIQVWLNSYMLMKHTLLACI